MRSVYSFIVKPKGKRYNNKKKVGDSELILNTEIFNHQYINREAEVIATPSAIKTEIKEGDTVILHHNVFRRWHNMQGVEKNSRSYIKEDLYAVDQMQKWEDGFTDIIDGIEGSEGDSVWDRIIGREQ